jgi:hypothetical protein
VVVVVVVVVVAGVATRFSGVSWVVPASGFVFQFSTQESGSAVVVMTSPDSVVNWSNKSGMLWLIWARMELTKESRW